MQDKNIIIGIGNLLLCDDGIGIIAIKYLQRNFEFSPKIELLDGGTLGLGLVEYFLEYDNVFIIDTLSNEAEAGSIYKIPSEEFLGKNSYKKTAHEVEVVQMLELCELYDKKANITIFGIVADDIKSMKIGLSELLLARFDTLIQILLQEIQNLGLSYFKNKNIPIRTIIEEF